MSEQRILRQMLVASGALRRGHFLLSSGLHSEAYVQCALLLEDPVRARKVGGDLAELLRSFHPDSVLSPAGRCGSGLERRSRLLRERIGSSASPSITCPWAEPISAWPSRHPNRRLPARRPRRSSPNLRSTWTAPATACDGRGSKINSPVASWPGLPSGAFVTIRLVP
ncbi:MAG: hypothetical protein WAM82_07535 [Thermoanaerobaculia bacterium]